MIYGSVNQTKRDAGHVALTMIGLQMQTEQTKQLAVSKTQSLADETQYKLEKQLFESSVYEICLCDVL